MDNDGTNWKQLETGEGNTKLPPHNKRCVPGRYWCFTFNNYKIEQMETLESLFKSKNMEYFFSEEVGDSGTPHLQGFINSPKKIRPLETFDFKEIHWEKCKGNKDQNIAYCSKSNGKIRTNMSIRRRVVDPLEGLEYYQYQKYIVDIIKVPCDIKDRSIHVLWEPKGGVGKSDFTTHLCLKYGAIAVSGAAADVKFAIAKLLETRDVDIVIWDVPRCSQDYVSWQGIEDVKNGRLFSTKFESGMVIFNKPHVIIFANAPPDLSKLSMDRWNIQRIENSGLRPYGSTPPGALGVDTQYVDEDLKVEDD